MYREHEPQFHLELSQLTYAEQLNSIGNQVCDLAFCKSNKIRRKGLTIKKIWEEELIVLLPTHHPMLKYRELPIQNVLKHPLIYFDKVIYKGYNEQLRNIFASVGVRPKIASYVKSYEMMLSLVSAGYGISLVTANKFNRFKSDMVVSRQIHNSKKRITLKTYLMSPTSSFHSPQAQKFMQYVVK